MQAPAPITLHPDAPRRFAEAVATLQATLERGAEATDHAARTQLAQVVKTVWFYPGAAPGQYQLAIDSDLAPLMDERTTSTAEASSGVCRSRTPVPVQLRA